MNDTAKRIVEDRMRRGDRRGGKDYGDYPDERRGDYRGSMEYRGELDYYGGRHGMGNRDHTERYREDHRGDYRNDYRGRDYGEGRHKEHYEEEMKLSKSDMKRWKKMLKNGDGSTGEHFTKEQLTEAMHTVGASFEGYDETDLCMAANMLYSDLGEALRPMVPVDKEPMIYAKLARYWLEDEDGPEGSEKLALYFYCIVEDDE